MVNPRPVSVTLDDPGEINYGDPVAFSSTVSGTLAVGDSLGIDYNFNPVPSSTDPVSTGSYSIEQTVVITDSTGTVNNVNYDLSVTDGPLVVNPGTLTITTEDVLIISGDDIPTEINTSIAGFITGEDKFIVFPPPDGPIYSYSSPEYETAGREAGTYLLLTTVSPDPLNYIVVDNTAQLLVNLSNGKKIRVFLDCVAANKGGQSEFPFTAYFSYENDNDASIFIEPMSPDNLLIGTSFDPSSVPFEFFPGSHQFPVPFVGEIRYLVATFGPAHNSSQQVDSENLKGQKCKPGDILVNGRTANPDSADDLNAFTAEEVQFYPNPVNDRLVVQVNENFSSNDFELYDSQGIRHDVNVLIDATTAEFDLSSFETGLYLLKLNIDGTTALIRILRQ